MSESRELNEKIIQMAQDVQTFLSRKTTIVKKKKKKRERERSIILFFIIKNTNTCQLHLRLKMTTKMC